MIYIAVVCILTVLILIYFKIADKYNIVDKPNERSSHTAITLRGGGIIFWFAALIYFALHLNTGYLFFTGITMVSFISFYDDIKSLPNKLRALVQFIAISISFYDLGLLQSQPWWLILIAYIFAVGIINAYNFMDGINGITGIYSIVVMLSFIAVNKYVIEFEDYDFLIFPILACVVFLFFNYRKKAKCFAGDIGSISMAFWIIYLMIKLMLITNSIIWLLFLVVYGVDSVCTILHRLYLKQNIFKPHRLHFYQILSNEQKIDHRVVSLCYGIVQGIASLATIYLYETMNEYLIMLVIITPLVLIYLIKFKLIKNGTKNN
ncbi:glycosyltransferase family 4 protein [Dysgonomonas sp. 520]|uniref:MraY family glycosyltransferase n=1 Tax=Dysgonomonas sp. 520 TaxID=2302931 RepID=UPI0013D0A692|nr:glycosyltransferase family 4 protein [Dysgonomonas sp. 520]NDW08952.1 UDP-GlcNAc--UDP-phosphate GlcNAc-1-phosphate transferase [Dysgonomonas sp. 520]